MIWDWGDFTSEADNDIALFLIYKESTAVLTPPAGWTEVAGFPVDDSVGGFKYRADLWWRRRAGEANNATYTWSWTGSTFHAGVELVYRGCITTQTPILTVGIDTEAAQTDQPVNPGIELTSDAAALLFLIWNFGNTLQTAPSGFTERWDNSAEGNKANDDLTTVSGATGTVTGNLVTPDYAMSVLLELASQVANTPEGLGRPFGLRGRQQMHQLLAR